MQSLVDQIKHTQAEAVLGTSVKVFSGGQIIKKGKIVNLTDWGAAIYNENNRYLDPKRGECFDVLPDTAQWYAFRTYKKGGELNGGIVLG